MPNTAPDLQKQVDHIANMLSNEFDPLDFGWDEDEIEERGSPSGMDWLEDVLDIVYLVRKTREGTEFVSARILVAFGGPNIWVDFNRDRVEGYWWGEYAEAVFNDVNGVEEALEELYSC